MGFMDRASLLLSLTFSIQKPCAVVLETGTPAQHIYYSLSGWGCKGSKLGFWIWGEARPGHSSCLNMKTMFRTCAAYPWGSWFGVGFALAGVLDDGGQTACLVTRNPSAPIEL